MTNVTFLLKQQNIKKLYFGDRNKEINNGPQHNKKKQKYNHGKDVSNFVGETRTCDLCNVKGHLKANCPQKEDDNKTPGSGVPPAGQGRKYNTGCFKCWSKAHFKSDCPYQGDAAVPEAELAANKAIQFSNAANDDQPESQDRGNGKGGGKGKGKCKSKGKGGGRGGRGGGDSRK